MENVRIHGLEEDRVSEDGLEQGGVEAGEVIRAIIDPVLSLVIVTVLQRRAGELWVAESESGRANYKAMQEAGKQHPIEEVGAHPAIMASRRAFGHPSK